MAIRVLALCCAALLLLVGCASNLPQTRESVSWVMENDYPRTIMVEFYSQDCNAAWPGGNEAYVLWPGETETFNLSCRTTEKICYGAWVQDNPDIYWGVGMGDYEGCADCCMRCMEGARTGYSLSD